MYKLIKCSSPSWEESRNTIEEIHTLLDLCVCNDCKINTFDEMKKSFENSEYVESFTDEDVQDALDLGSVSKEYDSMDTRGKVNELLSTSCGCEFVLECY